jgi:hypothetical protein
MPAILCYGRLGPFNTAEQDPGARDRELQTQLEDVCSLERPRERLIALNISSVRQRTIFAISRAGGELQVFQKVQCLRQTHRPPREL